jgi:hypothetical protein
VTLPFEDDSDWVQSVASVVGKVEVVLEFFSDSALGTQGMVGLPPHTRKNRWDRILGQSILTVAHRIQVE